MTGQTWTRRWPLVGPATLALALGLSGCGKGENDPGPGGVTVGEARALDDAAAMLDARRIPEAALHPSGMREAPMAPDTGAPPAL